MRTVTTNKTAVADIQVKIAFQRIQILFTFYAGKGIQSISHEFEVMYFKKSYRKVYVFLESGSDLQKFY